jgi:hypothetical protein
LAWGRTSSSTTTTTTTTDGGGTITEYTPGSVITLTEKSGTRHYRFGKTVTYVTKSGKTLDEETVKTRIKIGLPVHVHYTGEGDDMLVDRVIPRRGLKSAIVSVAIIRRRRSASNQLKRRRSFFVR